MRNITTLVVLLALAGCGGGDSPGSDWGGGSEPSPVPTPKPSASPSPTLPSAADFSRAISIQSPVAEVTRIETYTSDTPPFYSLTSATTRLLDSPGAATLEYDPSDKSASVRIGSYFLKFPGSTLSGEHPYSKSWQIHDVSSTDDDKFGWGSNEHLRFVASISQSEDRKVETTGPLSFSHITRFFIGCPATAATLLPKTGTFTFKGWGGVAIASAEKGAQEVRGEPSITVAIDAGTVSGTWQAEQHLYTLSGGYATNRPLMLQGKITRDDGLSGSFVGKLCGDGGKDLGLIFTMQGTNYALAGNIIAYRP